MNNILAEFISPIVSDLHHSDPTINQPHYDMPQNTNTPRLYEIFTDYVITKLKLISSGTTTNLSESEGQRKQLNRLNGIISFFTKETGGKVHEKCVVSVTASSEYSKSFFAKNVVDFDNLQVAAMRLWRCSFDLALKFSMISVYEILLLKRKTFCKKKEKVEKLFKDSYILIYFIFLNEMIRFSFI